MYDRQIFSCFIFYSFFIVYKFRDDLSQHVRWVEGLWDVTFYVCFVDNNCGKKISLHLKSCFLFSVLRLGEGLMKCEVPLGLMGHIGFKCIWTQGGSLKCCRQLFFLVYIKIAKYICKNE